MAVPDDMPAPAQDAPPTAVVARPANHGAAPAVQQTLALPAVPDAPVDTAPRAVAKRLWLCLYLPELSLDALRGHAAGPFAVFEEQHGVRRVLMVDAAAEAADIEPGLSVNAALSLCPELLLMERDPAREDALVQRLAAWADRFTSFVVVESANALLLEVAGSLRLYGGLDRIRRDISHALAVRGVHLVMAAAPTPLASLWLARAGFADTSEPGDSQQLAGRLRKVPLACTGWSDNVIDKLRGMGLTYVGDCMRLPRQGFARRFGVRLLNELDRALGRLPDPREHFRSPERFSADYEFDAELSNSEQILHACRELLYRLERFLRRRQVQIQRVRISFFHLQADATHLVLGCVRAGQGVEHWFELLQLRFEQTALPAPVIALRLCGGRGESASLNTPELLEVGKHQSASDPIEHLVERLHARMGSDAVQGVTTVAEHRPQYAWRPTPAVEAPPHCAAVAGFWNEADVPRLLPDIQRTQSLLLRRPLWMLEVPEPLPVRDGCPCYRGSRLRLSGPERLESGWWDDAGIARDYFVARDDDGVCLWVYRDRRKGRDEGERATWYLHGMFG